MPLTSPEHTCKLESWRIVSCICCILRPRTRDGWLTGVTVISRFYLFQLLNRSSFYIWRLSRCSAHGHFITTRFRILKMAAVSVCLRQQSGHPAGSPDCWRRHTLFGFIFVWKLPKTAQWLLVSSLQGSWWSVLVKANKKYLCKIFGNLTENVLHAVADKPYYSLLATCLFLVFELHGLNPEINKSLIHCICIIAIIVII